MSDTEPTAASATGPADERPTVSVHIIGLPLRLWAQTEEHADGLFRELRLIVASEARGREADVPEKLLHLVEELEAK